MCGICGIVDHKGSLATRDRVLAMADRLSHRGPDDQGVYLSSPSTPRSALGHRRLSIIDLSPLGHQPMANEDESAWIVLNGEIYNYKDLRKELEGKGHQFRSHTDTETVMHLYEEYGEECVKYLRGMFAFAIWDEKKKTLFAARDRAGKKPFLYFKEGSVFCFASEFASILESGLIRKEIEPVSIDQYLTFGYIPSPRTIYKGIMKLPPAHTLLLRGGEVTIKRYWDLDYSKKIIISEEDASNELIRLLEDAVKIRLYSDVPLGAFLSGGIDSSAIVALMSRIGSGAVKTFSIGFTEKAYDELKFARMVAERFNTDHNELIVKPDALKVLPLLVERYGEPYADSSCVPTYYLCNQTRKYVTVALNGDGGDELFAGYERYQAMLISERYRKIPSLMRRGIKGLVSLLPDSINQKNKLRRFKRFFDGIDMPFAPRYLRWIGLMSDGLKADIYSRDFKTVTQNSDPSDPLKPYLGLYPSQGVLDPVLSADTHTYLPDDLLVKVDIASMANSLEARSPFLDHKVMEFAASLPPEFKMKNLVKKYILKKALHGIIPDENIYRSKMGFGVPVGDWFRGELKELLTDTLLSDKCAGRGYFDDIAVEMMVSDHIEGRRDYTYQLWALLMLELWHEKFIG